MVVDHYWSMLVKAGILTSGTIDIDINHYNLHGFEITDTVCGGPPSKVILSENVTNIQQ